MLAALATGYIMIVAIPNANQTFREITFSVVSQRVETEIQPRVFYQDFPGWVLYEGGAGSGRARLEEADGRDHRPGRPATMHFAAKGRLVVDREKRTVDLVLIDGTSYRTAKPGETDTTRFTSALVLGLNPESVFPKINLQPGINEKTMAQLKQDALQKVKDGLSPHPEVIAIQQKFSFPVACLVFGVIGLALGLTVAREGKLAAFVVGTLIIFAYYIVMFLSESLTKGHYLNMYCPGGYPTSSSASSASSR